MAKSEKIEVLKDCNQLLDAINLCNEGKYIKSIRIPDILYDIIVLAPMSYTTFLLTKFCFDNNFDLTIISSAFSICIGCNQITLIYCTLVFEKSAMFKTMKIIQNLVNYRKSL